MAHVHDSGAHRRLFTAPVGTPAPNEVGSDGVPVTLTPEGVTAWHALGEAMTIASSLVRHVEEATCSHPETRVTYDDGERVFWTCRSCHETGSFPLLGGMHP